MAALFNTTKYEDIPMDDNEAPFRVQSSSRFPYLLRNCIYMIFGLVVGLFAGFNFNLTNSAPSLPYWSSARHSPIPAEVIVRKDVFFEPDYRYIGNTKEIDRNWDILVDSDAIWIGTPEAFGLGQGMQPPPKSSRPVGNTTALPSNFYDVSTLHQVHCLSVLRRRYWQLMTKGYEPNDPKNAEMESHVEHCIEYMRLAITCGDFLTIEPNDSGWGIAHSCIDFERLRSFQDAQEALWIESWPTII